MNGDVPTNGGTARDYLQRIEQKANHAAEVAEQSMTATLRLQRVLIGDPSLVPGDTGKIGEISDRLEEFIAATKARENAYEGRKRAQFSTRLSALSVVVLALGVAASLIVAFVHP